MKHSHYLSFFPNYLDNFLGRKKVVGEKATLLSSECEVNISSVSKNTGSKLHVRGVISGSKNWPCCFGKTNTYTCVVWDE